MDDPAFRTRRATTEDAEVVGRISAAAYIPSYVPLIGAAPKPAYEDYGEWIDRGELWLAEIEGVPVGVLVLDRRSDHLLIYSVAVLPRQQGTGLGKALLAFAEERADAMGSSELRLYTNRRMERNVRLYERCGFVAVGERPHPSRPDEVLVDMVKPVAGGRLSVEGVQIQRAGPADADAVRELTRVAYAKWVPLLGREPGPMTADYDVAVRSHIVDLLYVDGKLAGLIEMIHEPACLLIENVAVAPTLQGQGYGRTLMKHAEDLARSLRLRRTRLYTNQRFAQNISLYHSLGYYVDRQEMLPNRIAVHMSKPLEA